MLAAGCGVRSQRRRWWIKTPGFRLPGHKRSYITASSSPTRSGSPPAVGGFLDVCPGGGGRPGRLMADGLDFQAGIFQKLIAEVRRRAKRAAASTSRPLGPLRTGKLQRPISKEPKGTSKNKVGGGARWWRAALRFLRWDRRGEHRGGARTKAGAEEAERSNADPKLNPNLPLPPSGSARRGSTLYFVSADSHRTGDRRFTPRKRRLAGPDCLRRAPDGVVGTRMGFMMLLSATAPYVSLPDLNDLEEEEEEGKRTNNTRLVALLARPPPPPPIYWVA